MLTSRVRHRIFAGIQAPFTENLSFVTLIPLVPAVAIAQSGSPFDAGFTALQNLFTGTVAKGASLVAIGGYDFAHGEPGARKAHSGGAAAKAGVESSKHPAHRGWT